MIDCKAHEVDLRAAVINNANLSGTDFYDAQFNKTDLCKADLRRAINYRINPTENKITKAKFSDPEVMNLLRAFDIKIDSE